MTLGSTFTSTTSSRSSDGSSAATCRPPSCRDGCTPPPASDWLAVAGTVVYMLHFMLPIATALLLWRYRPELFHPYLVSLILLSFAGFVTYLFLPVAPPWFAAEAGKIGSAPGEAAITYLKPAAFADLVGFFGLDGGRLYNVAFTSLNANPVAAFPSLHAAYPFLTFLVLRRAFGGIAWAAFAYFTFVALHRRLYR